MFPGSVNQSFSSFTDTVHIWFVWHLDSDDIFFFSPSNRENLTRQLNKSCCHDSASITRTYGQRGQYNRPCLYCQKHLFQVMSPTLTQHSLGYALVMDASMMSQSHQLALHASCVKDIEFRTLTNINVRGIWVLNIFPRQTSSKFLRSSFRNEFISRIKHREECMLRSMRSWERISFSSRKKMTKLIIHDRNLMLLFIRNNEFLSASSQ